MRARRPPVALPAVVLALVAVAVVGSGVFGASSSPLAGTFAVLRGDDGDDDDGDDGDVAPVSSIATDDTALDESPPLTALGPGELPGVDWSVFDDEIAPSLIRQGASAVGIAVAKDGMLVHSAAYGVRDPESGDPVEATDRFRVASNSKVVTSIVALSLVDDGLLTLDEPALEPLAAQLGVELSDPRMRDVTLRHLLGHTSGFADFRDEFFRGASVGCEDATIAAYGRSLGGAPGRSVNYSNMNFCIAGLLIELATGDSYEAATYDRLLTPLSIDGMRMTGNGDVRDGEVVHPGDPGRNFMEVLGGAGGWLASAADLVQILDSVDTSRPGWHPISTEMATEMLGLGERAEPSRSFSFGLGMRLFGADRWGHTGTIQNAHSMVMHRPDGFTFAIVASGSAPSESDDLERIADRAFDAIGASLLADVAPRPLEPVDRSTTTNAPTTSTSTTVPETTTSRARPVSTAVAPGTVETTTTAASAETTTSTVVEPATTPPATTPPVTTPPATTPPAEPPTTAAG